MGKLKQICRQSFGKSKIIIKINPELQGKFKTESPKMQNQMLKQIKRMENNCHIADLVKE